MITPLKITWSLLTTTRCASKTPLQCKGWCGPLQYVSKHDVMHLPVLFCTGHVQHSFKRNWLYKLNVYCQCTKWRNFSISQKEILLKWKSTCMDDMKIARTVPAHDIRGKNKTGQYCSCCTSQGRSTAYAKNERKSTVFRHFGHPFCQILPRSLLYASFPASQQLWQNYLFIDVVRRLCIVFPTL